MPFAPDSVPPDIRVDLDIEAMTRMRRDLHAHPELGFQELRTADAVAQRLRQWGYAVEMGVAQTGVVATLRLGEGERRIGLRADMDALPIQEDSGLPWTSKHSGIMHACGHDGHTAMLLGAAQALAKRRRFDGALHLIFQPAEELGGGGGAQRMLEEGLFDRYPCDAVYALHNMPGYPAGTLVFGEGVFMASSDKAILRFEGVGGHGALPHKTVDPTLAAAGTVLALQSIVGRNIDPLESAVISTGVMRAGQAYNVIPDHAALELSVRSLHSSTRSKLEHHIRRVAEGQASAYGVKVQITYQSGYPVLVNTGPETHHARGVAENLFGTDRVQILPKPLMGSEDFAFMLQRCRGSYFLLGNGNTGQQGGCMVHNPGYDFNDDCLGTGAAFWVALAEACLPVRS